MIVFYFHVGGQPPRTIQGFSERCPFCNSEVEPIRPPRPEDTEPEEWICQCGAGTENGKWQEGNL